MGAIELCEQCLSCGRGGDGFPVDGQSIWREYHPMALMGLWQGHLTLLHLRVGSDQ